MTKKDDDFIQRTLNEFQRFLRLSGPAASASYSLLGAIILLSLIGYIVDNRYSTYPIFFISGLLAGLIIGFYELYKFINRK
jgi:F0F1-type ATP synthase assembly protein I|tara:strand:+ start:1098 stop:1340 length:243 start_codon:yes stop_codon:yes gene_type:complete